MRRPGLWLDVAVKLALAGLLLWAVVQPDAPQFEGKGMTARAIAYPLAVLIVPAIWFLFGRSRGWSYPLALDVLFSLPFLIDVAGNAADLYDTIDWWDDLNHFVNWTLLTAGFGQLLVRRSLQRWTAFGLAVGFGSVSALVWEYLEYITFIRDSPELRTAYTDTLGDLGLGTSGSVLAAALTVSVLWPRAGSRPARASR